MININYMKIHNLYAYRLNIWTTINGLVWIAILQMMTKIATMNKKTRKFGNQQCAWYVKTMPIFVLYLPVLLSICLHENWQKWIILCSFFFQILQNIHKYFGYRLYLGFSLFRKHRDVSDDHFKYDHFLHLASYHIANNLL